MLDKVKDINFKVEKEVFVRQLDNRWRSDTKSG